MTMIELLVVMTIIAALTSLVVGAVFTVREAQMKSFTETLVQKLASALDQHWKAATDQIREEPVPIWAFTMANNDPRIAKVIYLKTRLKQEFPVSFFEAIYPNANYTPGQVAKYQTPGNSPNDLPPKSAYARALGTLTPPSGAYIPAIGSTIFPPDNALPANLQGFEASALLYMALSQGRRGLTGFNPDENVEPTAIRTATVGGVTLKYFVDSWGNPVRHWAFPYLNTELNESPYRQDISKNGIVTTQNQQSPDPQDPERAFAAFTSAQYLLQPNFVQMVHPVQPNGPNSPPVLQMLIPVVGSAGHDSQWGMSEYFLMTPDGTGGDNDNIYSYRLRRVGRRGD
jgi:type II secretory pathway pseudopilin PulG